MKDAYIKLHISILLAGFTGVFGKLIMLNEGFLVWYRLFITAVVLFAFMLIRNKLRVISFREFSKIACVGSLLALHWVFFYGSIKASNVSVGVICFSLTCFFTAIFEPFVNKRSVSCKEVCFSLIAVLGILLIFQFDVRYRNGIILGVISSAFCSLFAIYNKRVSVKHDSSTMLLYEMVGGLFCVSLLLPFYISYFPQISCIPTFIDLVYLIILSVFCTIGLCILQIQALRKISAFAVNLSFNLEPIYSILLAMLIFHEGKELNIAFYFGLSLILLSVLLQMYDTLVSTKRMR